MTPHVEKGLAMWDYVNCIELSQLFLKSYKLVSKVLTRDKVELQYKVMGAIYKQLNSLLLIDTN